MNDPTQRLRAPPETAHTTGVPAREVQALQSPWNGSFRGIAPDLTVISLGCYDPVACITMAMSYDPFSPVLPDPAFE